MTQGTKGLAFPWKTYLQRVTSLGFGEELEKEIDTQGETSRGLQHPGAVLPHGYNHHLVLCLFLTPSRQGQALAEAEQGRR